MIKQLTATNLTLFPGEHRLEFAAGLNVFVGENGTGKTHLLKAAYALLATSEETGRKQPGTSPTKTLLQRLMLKSSWASSSPMPWGDWPVESKAVPAAKLL